MQRDSFGARFAVVAGLVGIGVFFMSAFAGGDGSGNQRVDLSPRRTSGVADGGRGWRFRQAALAGRLGVAGYHHRWCWCSGDADRKQAGANDDLVTVVDHHGAREWPAVDQNAIGTAQITDGQRIASDLKARMLAAESGVEQAYATAGAATEQGLPIWKHPRAMATGKADGHETPPKTTS